jgi:hypothetical protein
MCEVSGYELVLDPVGEQIEPPASPGSGMRVEGSLQGKKIAIVDNRMDGMRELARALEAKLGSYDVRDVRYWMVPHSIAPAPDVIEEISSKFDAAVIGLGNCGACTTWECQLSATLRGSIPTLDVVTEPFVHIAKASFRGHGLPTQPLVVLPAHVEQAGETEIESCASVVAEACFVELTVAGQA